MKLTLNGPKGKGRKKNVSNTTADDSTALQGKKARGQMAVPDYMHYYNTPQGFSFRVPLERSANPSQIVLGPPRMYSTRKPRLLAEKASNNATKYKESVDSDIEFLLTSSSERSRVVEIPRNQQVYNQKTVPTHLDDGNNAPGGCIDDQKAVGDHTKCEGCRAEFKNSYFSKIDQIFDTKSNPKERPKHEEEINVSELLKSKEDALRDILYNIPHYFYALKGEYLNFKCKYEKTAADLIEQKKVSESLGQRVSQLVEDTASKGETILKLMSENELLKNKQEVLDSYKLEKDSFIELIKRDSDGKTREINELISENGKLKCMNSKVSTERDILERELKENRRNFIKLESEKNVLRTEIENLRIFTESTLQKYLDSGLFNELERICLENRKLVHFQHFFETVKAEVAIFRQNFGAFQRSIKSGGSKLCLNIENQSEHVRGVASRLHCLENIKKEQREAFSNISNKLCNVKQALETLAEAVGGLKGLFSVEKLKLEFINIINAQRSEFEIQKQAYEKRIKDLTEKIEEEEDIWDVFE